MPPWARREPYALPARPPHTAKSRAIVSAAEEKASGERNCCRGGVGSRPQAGRFRYLSSAWGYAHGTHSDGARSVGCEVGRVVRRRHERKKARARRRGGVRSLLSEMIGPLYVSGLRQTPAVGCGLRGCRSFVQRRTSATSGGPLPLPSPGVPASERRGSSSRACHRSGSSLSCAARQRSWIAASTVASRV